MRMALAFAILAATGCAAVADSGPVIVIPSRPGVPLIVNGRDISYAVLEGDWGLGKGVHVQPTVYPGNWQRNGMGVDYVVGSYRDMRDLIVRLADEGLGMVLYIN